MDVFLRGHTVNATSSGFSVTAGQAHCNFVLVDFNVPPSRVILPKSLDAVCDGDTGRPVRFQSSRVEVKLVLDP